uniref:Uncharacterized protein n=1 Tax=Roseihalotalea indica TaxID=2867963 RepID=A0AA49JEV6_9BACT|nr:hypothetical protein K4G66_20450 [Tunicatimonas sp. TK19036]
MHDGLAGAIIVGVIFYGIVSIVKTITDYQLRRKLISLGHVDQKSTEILSQTRNSHLDSLKWGLIILFGGIGFIIISIPIINIDSPLPFGIMSVCIALGFLLYFFIAQRMTEKVAHKNEVYSS